MLKVPRILSVFSGCWTRSPGQHVDSKDDRKWGDFEIFSTRLFGGDPRGACGC